MILLQDNTIYYLINTGNANSMTKGKKKKCEWHFYRRRYTLCVERTRKEGVWGVKIPLMRL